MSFTTGSIDIKTEGSHPDPLRSGVKTTEFWFSMVGFIVGLLLVIFGKTELQQQAGFALLSLTPTGYAFTRTFLKKGAAKVAAVLLVFCMIGCGSIQAEYVGADEATYEDVGVEYLTYVEAGYRFTPDGQLLLHSNPDKENFGTPIFLTEDEKEFRRRSVRLWKARIDDAKASLAKEAE